MPRNNNNDDDGDNGTPGVAEFQHIHSNEGTSGLAFAAGAARGGIVGGLVGAALAPIAEGAGHMVARLVGLEKSDED
jgi:hypothetical protein